MKINNFKYTYLGEVRERLDTIFEYFCLKTLFIKHWYTILTKFSFFAM